MIPVIIPARGGSKGIPRKNVQVVAGLPLIVHAINAARTATCVSAVWVSTDDDEIAAVSARAGARVVRRPAELASDTASSESALLHALDEIERQGGQAEVFCFVQCTSPLTRGQDIDGAYDWFVRSNADTLLTVTRNHRFLWRRKEDGTGVEGINHDAARRLRRQDLAPEFAENGAFYLMKTAGFRERRHRFFGRTELYEMPAETTVEIDEPEDFGIIEALLQRRSQPQSRTIPVDVRRLKAVVFDFDGVMTDDRVSIDEDGRESAVCSRSDGMGIELLRASFPGQLLILSREKNPIVLHRARKLNIPCIHGVGDKLPVLQQWAAEAGIPLHEVAYVGNDVNDSGCLAAVGLSAAPCDAHPDVRSNVHLRLSHPGGRGAVREFCDFLISHLNNRSPEI